MEIQRPQFSEGLAWIQTTTRRLSRSIPVALGVLSLCLSAWATDMTQVIGIKASPVDKQVILSLTQGKRATLISPLEKGQRQLIVDISGASLDLKEKAALLKLIKSQLAEVQDITLDEFRVNKEPMVRMVITTRTPSISGALMPDHGNALVLQLLKQEADPAAATAKPVAPATPAKPTETTALEQAPDKLPTAVLSAQTSKNGFRKTDKLLESKIDEAEVLRFERNNLADQVKNLQTLVSEQHRMIAHLRDQQELLMVKNSIEPEKDRIISLQRDLEELSKSYDAMKQTMMTYQKQIVAQDDALKAAQDKINATEAQATPQPVAPDTAMSRGGLLNTLASLSPADVGTLVSAESAFREGKKMELQGNSAAAELQYKKALQHAPQVTEYSLALGTLYITQNKLEEAKTVLKNGLRYHPEDTDLLNELGKTALLQKDNATALHYFADALPAGVLSNYASTLKRAQRMGDAESAYKMALALNPNDSDLQFNLGNLYLWQKRLPEAQEHFREAIRMNPGFAEAHYHLGLTYVEEGRFDMAKTELRTYLDKMPNASNKTAVESYLKDLDKVYFSNKK